MLLFCKFAIELADADVEVLFSCYLPLKFKPVLKVCTDRVWVGPVDCGRLLGCQHSMLVARKPCPALQAERLPVLVLIVAVDMRAEDDVCSTCLETVYGASTSEQPCPLHAVVHVY